MDKIKIEELRLILKKDISCFSNIIKSIGIDKKKDYSLREVKLIISFLSMTEQFILDEKYTYLLDKKEDEFSDKNDNVKSKQKNKKLKEITA